MISVIIPVYNVELYIKQCLDSVINQTYTDLQIIIIDDGSTDGSKAICEEYANRDSRMVFISQENAGVSSARNKGIEQATGEWISFVDADDWLELNAYEKILDYSNKYDTPDLIVFNRKIMKNGMLVDYSDFEELKYINSKNDIDKYQLSAIYKGFTPAKKKVGMVYIWDKLYRRDIIKQFNVHFPVKAYGQNDRYFNTYYLGAIKDILIIPEALYCYRYLNTSLAHKYVPNRVMWDEIIYTELSELKNNASISVPDLFEQALYCRMIENVWLGAGRCFFHKENKASLMKKIWNVHKVFQRDLYKNAFNMVNKEYLNLQLKLLVSCRYGRALFFWALYTVSKALHRV